MRIVRVGDGELYLPPRQGKPHIWRLVHEDEFLRGWWVFDPVNVLPLGPFDWAQVQRVAKSCAQSRDELRGGL